MSDSDAGSEERVNPELDWKSQAILRAIADNDGTADTGEIRSLTGIDSYSPLNYRINKKLEPAGLIDVMHPTPNSAEGGTPAKVITLTQNGQQVAERIAAREGDSEAASITDQLEQLEAQCTALETRFDEITDGESATPSKEASNELFQDRFAEIEAQLDTLADDRDVLLTAMTAYDAIFETVFDIETDQFRPETDVDQQRSIEQIRERIRTRLVESHGHE